MKIIKRISEWDTWDWLINYTISPFKFGNWYSLYICFWMCLFIWFRIRINFDYIQNQGISVSTWIDLYTTIKNENNKI